MALYCRIAPRKNGIDLLKTLWRTSVTVSWPIMKGKDFTKWNDFLTKDLVEIQVAMEHFENNNTGYRYRHNHKHRVAKNNVAKIMGVDPEKFTDTEFRLSLMYLMPSDIQKEEYQPKISTELPISSSINMLQEYNSSKAIKIQFGSLKKTGHSLLLAQLQDMIEDAERRVMNKAGLELYLDPEEVVTLPPGTAGNVTEERSLGRHIPSADDMDHIPSADDMDHIPSAHGMDVFGVFPFLPKKTDNEMVNEIMDLQFYKLNSTIKDRPDLIKSYHKTLRPVLFSGHGIIPHKQALKSKLDKRLFRAKVAKNYYHQSVITTVVPGSGKITIDGVSYLDALPHPTSRITLITPFRLSDTLGLFDVSVEIVQERVADGSDGAGFATCVAMSIADCLKMYCPDLKECLRHVYVREYRKEYKKANKKNSRARRKWRKR